MHCLIVAATAGEIASFEDYCQRQNGTKATSIQCSTLISGVGMLPTAWQLTKAIAKHHPDLVIQAGIAGSFDTSLPLGSIVAVKAEKLADLGVMENRIYKDLFDMGFMEANTYPFEKAALVNNHNDLLALSGLPQVTGITVNQVTTNEASILIYKEKYTPVVESMEGAALHYVCLQEKIPFIQLRSISNYIGERNKQQWKIKEAVENLHQSLFRFIQQLSVQKLAL